MRRTTRFAWCDCAEPRPARSTARCKPLLPSSGSGLNRCVRGSARPTSLMVDYIDQHRHEFGVESICNVLPIAPSTYHDHKTRRRVHALFAMPR
jgi:hypothetical protein